jgi:hypothetical protein
MLPGDDGCLTNNTRIRTTTMHGKSMTTPSGTDMLEFPLNLNGLRKKARRKAHMFGRVFGFSSDVGNWGGPDPTSLLALRKRSITTDLYRVVRSLRATLEGVEKRGVCRKIFGSMGYENVVFYVS